MPVFEVTFRAHTTVLVEAQDARDAESLACDIPGDQIDFDDIDATDAEAVDYDTTGDTVWKYDENFRVVKRDD